MTEKTFFNRMGWFLAIYIGLWVGVQLLVTMLIDLFAPAAWQYEWVFWISVIIPNYVIAFPVFALLCKKLPRRNLYPHSIKGGQMFQAYTMAVALMLIGNIIGIVLTTVLTRATGHDFTVDATDVIMSHGLGGVFLVAVLIGPIVEELIFRKLLLDRLVVFGDGVAILVSALLFALIHGNFSQLFYAFGLGLIFGFVYVRTGKIQYTIGLHIVFNFMGGFVPALFMNSIDLVSMEEALLQGNFSVIMNHIGALFGFLGFELIVWILGIIGFILLILNRKKFKLNQGEISLKKAEVFRLFFTTPGMLICLLLIVGLFVMNVAGI